MQLLVALNTHHQPRRTKCDLELQSQDQCHRANALRSLILMPTLYFITFKVNSQGHQGMYNHASHTGCYDVSLNLHNSTLCNFGRDPYRKCV